MVCGDCHGKIRVRRLCAFGKSRGRALEGRSLSDAIYDGALGLGTHQRQRTAKE